jgi:AraC-like DNA-binding protein
MTSLVQQLMQLAKNDGYNRTALSGVGVYKTSTSVARGPLCYSQGIIFVVQGQKHIHFNQQTYCYNADNYLVLTIPLAAECETITEENEPLLAITIDLDMNLLNELVRLFHDFGQGSNSNTLQNSKSVFVSKCTPTLSQLLEKLANCLTNPLHTAALGMAIIREIYFHILSGPQAMPLFALVSHNSYLAKLDKVMKYFHANIDAKLDVEQLADMANMSTSTFHRNFKYLTASSPIQYVKKLRLNRARELLQDHGIKVKQAAAQVGYESPHQFSREFTRYFGVSPSELG